MDEYRDQVCRWRAHQGICLIDDCQRYAWNRPLCNTHLRSSTYEVRVVAWNKWLQAHLSVVSEECWRPVPGYIGYYEVSDRGRVRSCARVIPTRNGQQRQLLGRVLRQRRHKKLYRSVCLYLRGSKRMHLVHVLVLEAFVGPRPSGLETCHNNGNPADNRVVNLRWGTRESNMLDVVRHASAWNVKKDRCLRGHQLVPPNLVEYALARGRRSCLACKRTHGIARNARRRGVTIDFQVVSDQRYAQIIRAA